MAALDAKPEEPEAKAIIEALGKLGGERSYEALAKRSDTAGELGRIVREARGKLERSRARAADTTLDDRAKPAHAIPLLLHVRAGLEALLLAELDEDLDARAAGRGRIAVELTGRLMKLWKARTFLHMGFPLPLARIEDPSDPASLEEAVVRSLTSDHAPRSGGTPPRQGMHWN